MKYVSESVSSIKLKRAVAEEDEEPSELLRPQEMAELEQLSFLF